MYMAIHVPYIHMLYSDIHIYPSGSFSLKHIDKHNINIDINSDIVIECVNINYQAECPAYISNHCS